jgi:hypothetical protein
VTLLPAATELGDAEFATTRFACVFEATTSVAVALLLARFGSVMAELTEAVSLICVPAAVPAVTFKTTVNVEEPGAKLGSVQLIVPVAPIAGVVHDQPAGIVIDWNVVLAGVVSVMLAVVAVLGPLFVTTCVYVMLFPACTPCGLAELVMARSAESATCVLTVTLLLALFGSVVVDETVSVCAMFVPEATFVFTFTTKVKLAVVFAAIAEPSVHL